MQSLNTAERLGRRCRFGVGRALAGAAGLILTAAAPATSATSSGAAGAPFVAAAPAPRHEVPADVAVQAYVRPAGSTLTVLVRVPLESMRDVEFPRRDGGVLDLADPRLPALLDEAAQLWIAGYLAFFEEGRPLGPEQVLATRLSIPSDRSFDSFLGAMGRLEGERLPATVALRPEQAFLDVHLTVPIADPSSRFAVDPELAHLGVETVSVIHLVLPDGAERVFRYEGNPGRLELDPRWSQAVARFTGLGFGHILGGFDHLLFLLCLVLPLRSVRALVPVVTAFTVAHSITLLAAALGMAPAALWFGPLVEVLIAASIVWMALENIVGAGLSHRWAVAFAFGLVHGFGFSFVLTESLQLAGRHLVSSLLAFNVGVELGQLAVLVVAVPLLRWAFRAVVSPRMGVVVISVLVAHTAWHWMTERGAAVLAYDVRLPAWDAAFLAAAMRWTMLALVAVGAAWLLSGAVGAYRRTVLETEA